MFETKERRDVRLTSDAKLREAGVRRYEKAMGVELPYSPVNAVDRVPAVEQKKAVEASESEKPVRVAKFDRKAYQRDLMRKRRAAAKSGGSSLKVP